MAIIQFIDMKNKKIEEEINKLTEKERDGCLGAGVLESELYNLFLSVIQKESNLTKCNNCGQMVEMISPGEFCPKCFF